MRFQILLATLLLMLVLPTFGPAAAQVTDDAVVNGGFEVAAYPARPVMCEVFGEGYLNIFEPGNPFGLPWLVIISACQSGTFKAAGWSSGMTTDMGDFDDDGDREARFVAGSSDSLIGNHNMWQSYASPHQLYTGNFAAYELTVVSGDIPSSASIILSMTTERLPSTGLTCQLKFGSALLAPDGDGRISIDPTEGHFTSRSSSCNDAKAAWDAAAPGSDERREVLDSLHLIQNSFWGWNVGADDVVIDDVTMVGSRLVPQALLP